ncbi:MAG: hypothetical protein ACKVP1_19140 [Burkholderiaceae bacterium]
MSSTPLASAGHLSIWTDVDPEHELDFNRWYDREHMQERMSIPGFRSGRRFRSIVSCPRPYLALYDTDSVQIFRSNAYRQAFAKQTDWSQRSFGRMRDTQRRVGELTVEVGRVEGGALALFVIKDDSPMLDHIKAGLQAVVARDHIVRASLLCTDVALSAPLSATAAPAQADRVAMIEATDAASAFDAASSLASQLPAEQVDSVFVFQMMMRLGN